MKKKAIMFKVLLGLFTSLLGAKTYAQCPDVTKGETAEDCPWADVTRAVTGITDDQQIEAIIDQKIPGFMDQIRKDATAPDLLGLWGLSNNRNDGDLVDPIILPNLLQFFSLDPFGS